MDGFEIPATVAHLSIMVPRKSPLTIVRNGCNNTVAMGWTDQISTSPSDIAGAILYAHAFTLWDHHVTESITDHPRARNRLVDDAYR